MQCVDIIEIFITFRPSDIHFVKMDAHEMSTQLETASISNALLREEVKTLQRERESMCRRLANTQQEVIQKQGVIEDVDQKVLQAEQSVKVKCSS